MFLVDAYRLPRLVQPFLYAIAHAIGEMCFLLQDFPRLTVTEFKGNGWRILFVGGEKNHAEICSALFDDQCERRRIGRVSLWSLSRCCEEWFDSGVHMVISEVSAASPWKLQASIRFVIPAWIRMIVTMPDPLETILSGNKRKHVRQRVKKGTEAGFHYRFSRTKADFDVFHYQMYRPFIMSRHGDRAALSNYDHQWKRWFQRGGLVLVTHNEQAVGGALCYVANGVCHSVEGGILNAHPDLIKQGLNGMIDWYSMAWSHEQGVRTFDMGGTRARRSDGVFLYKRQWGARPRNINRKLHRSWTFLGRNIPTDLRDQLNRLGFISRIGDQFYGVHIHTDPDPLGNGVIEQLRESWAVEGVDGVMVLSPRRPAATYSVVSANAQAE